jgi:hypothetical protein
MMQPSQKKNRRYEQAKQKTGVTFAVQNTLRRFFFGEGLHHFEDSGAGAPARRRRRPREETGATEGGGNT